MKKYVLIGAVVALLTISLVSGAGYYKVNKYKNFGAACQADSECFGGTICKSGLCSERTFVKSGAPKIVSGRAVGTGMIKAARESQIKRQVMKSSVLAPTTGLYAYEKPKEKKEALDTKKTAFTGMKTGQVVSNKLSYGKGVKKSKSKSIGATGMTIRGGKCDIARKEFPPCGEGLRCHAQLHKCVSAYH